jgi:hypothetical protein
LNEDFPVPNVSLTSENAELQICSELTLLAEGFLAKTSAMQDSGQASMGSVQDCGQNISGSLASYDRKSRSWRTSQLCLDGELSEFSGTWPRSGMTRSGGLYRLATLALPTCEKGSGLFPTPRRGDADKRGDFDETNPRNGFVGAVKRIFLPTLGKNEFKGSSRKRYRGSKHFRGAKMSEGLGTCAEDAIYLNPSFGELVMGFPIGWTELVDSETPSSRKSRSGSVKGSSQRRR